MVLSDFATMGDFMSQTYGIAPSLTHPIFASCFRVLCLHRMRTPFDAPGGFYHLDSPIPAYTYRVSLGSPDSSLSRTKYPRMQILAFSDSAGSSSSSHITLLFTWPSPSVHGVGTRKKVISELNGLPTLPPVNITARSRYVTAPAA